jgi:putative methionine-R-sulfoxide reductase with GAF domain
MKKENVSNNNIQDVLEIITDLTSNLDIDTILTKINNSAGRLVSAEGASIMLFDDEKQYLNFIATSGEKARILRRMSVRDGVAWDVAQSGEAAIVNDTASDPRFTGSVDKATDFKTKTILAVPVILKGEILGVLEAVNKIAGAKFTEADKRLFGILANQIAIVISNARIAEDQQNFFINSIELFVKAIESVGVTIGLMSQGHCWRVAKLSTAIGSDFEISGTSFDDLYYGAVLHDIGILEQPKDESTILFDQGQWDQGVWGNVQSHPVVGANIIKNFNLLRGAVPIIRHHHEHFDGTGYPDGLKGDNIPLGARIVAVAETYEEMLSGGLTSESKVKKIAIEGTKKSSGTILDPFVVGVFLSFIDSE